MPRQFSDIASNLSKRLVHRRALRLTRRFFILCVGYCEQQQEVLRVCVYGQKDSLGSLLRAFGCIVEREREVPRCCLCVCVSVIVPPALTQNAGAVYAPVGL